MLQCLTSTKQGTGALNKSNRLFWDSPQNGMGLYVKQLPFSPLSCPRSEDPAEHRKKICCAREFKCSTRAVTDSNAHSARKASTRTTSASLYVWGSGASSLSDVTHAGSCMSGSHNGFSSASIVGRFGVKCNDQRDRGETGNCRRMPTAGARDERLR